MASFMHKVCNLPDDEGSVVVITEMPEEDIVLSHTFTSFQMMHGSSESRGEMVGHYCGGRIDIVRVSAEKTVLHCVKCGLRKEIPWGLLTYRDLNTSFLYV